MGWISSRQGFALAGVTLAAVVLAGCAGSPSQRAGRGVVTKVEGGVDPKYGVTASRRVVDTGKPIPRGGGRNQIGKPYTIAGKRYVPREEPGYDRVGTASWYGADFHGRLTANGEIYDKTALSAAHTTMPLPSYARVTNLSNGKSVIVRVNDRGPYHGNRIIDLSQKVAEILDFRHRGLAQVRVQYVGRASTEGSDDRLLISSYREGGGGSIEADRRAIAQGYRGGVNVASLSGPTVVASRPPASLPPAALPQANPTALAAPPGVAVAALPPATPAAPAARPAAVVAVATLPPVAAPPTAPTPRATGTPLALDPVSPSLSSGRAVPAPVSTSVPAAALPPLTKPAAQSAEIIARDLPPAVGGPLVLLPGGPPPVAPAPTPAAARQPLPPGFQVGPQPVMRPTLPSSYAATAPMEDAFAAFDQSSAGIPPRELVAALLKAAPKVDRPNTNR
jgi:rare lipoprotein A